MGRHIWRSRIAKKKKEEEKVPFRNSSKMRTISMAEEKGERPTLTVHVANAGVRVDNLTFGSCWCLLLVSTTLSCRALPAHCRHRYPPGTTMMQLLLAAVITVITITNKHNNKHNKHNSDNHNQRCKLRFLTISSLRSQLSPTLLLK